MTPRPDVLIIGAGIVGTACAWALSREGLRVEIIEEAVVGGGATAAGMGHVVVMDLPEPEFRLSARSREVWSDMERELPRDVEFERRGTLWIASDDEEMSEARRKFEYLNTRGVKAEMLDSRTLAEAEPNLRAGLAGGLLVPDDIVLYAPSAASWMLKRALSDGATVRLGQRVTEIFEGGVTLSGGDRLAAGCTVCAAGTAAFGLFQALPLQPKKGHLAITDRYPGYVRCQLVELGYMKSAHGPATESVAFNVQPRSTGQVLIGSSRQLGVTDCDVDRGMLGRMLSRAREYMPSLGGLDVIRTWTGFRAATPDGLPLIGPHPAFRTAYLATGHEGLGITTSVGTAEIIASMVMGRECPIPPEPYLPARLMGNKTNA